MKKYIKTVSYDNTEVLKLTLCTISLVWDVIASSAGNFSPMQ